MIYFPTLIVSIVALVSLQATSANIQLRDDTSYSPTPLNTRSTSDATVVFLTPTWTKVQSLDNPDKPDKSVWGGYGTGNWNFTFTEEPHYMKEIFNAKIYPKGSNKWWWNFRRNGGDEPEASYSFECTMEMKALPKEGEQWPWVHLTHEDPWLVVTKGDRGLFSTLGCKIPG